MPYSPTREVPKSSNNYGIIQVVGGSSISRRMGSVFSHRNEVARGFCLQQNVVKFKMPSEN